MTQRQIDLPRVSILLPNLNGGEFLPPRLNSIRAQTFVDWEVIVMDGFSDDGSWEMFITFALGDARVRLHRAAREGVYAAINAALRLARGEFIYIATSDDTMAPDCFEKMVQALDQNPGCGLCHCNVEFIDAEGAALGGYLEMPASLYFGDMLCRKHIRAAPHDAVLSCMLGSVYVSLTQLLIRKKVFDEVGDFPTEWQSRGDYVWNMRAASRFDTFHIPEVLSTWRLRSTSASAREDNKQFYDDVAKMVEANFEFVAASYAGRPGLPLRLADLILPLRIAQYNADVVHSTFVGSRTRRLTRNLTSLARLAPQTLWAAVKALIFSPKYRWIVPFNSVGYAKTLMVQCGLANALQSEDSIKTALVL